MPVCIETSWLPSAVQAMHRFRESFVMQQLKCGSPAGTLKRTENMSVGNLEGIGVAYPIGPVAAIPDRLAF